MLSRFISRATLIGLFLAASGLASAQTSESIIKQNDLLLPSSPARNTFSEFFSTPGESRTTIQLGITSSASDVPSPSYRESTGSNADVKVIQRDYAFKAARGITKNWSASVDLGYRASDLAVSGEENSGYNYRAQAQGLRDYQIGVVYLNDNYQEGNWIYGLNLGLSPVTADTPGANNSGNSFSGGTTFSPWVGFESHPLAEGVVGGNLSISQVMGRTARNYRGSDETFGFDLKGFYEFPVAKGAIVGIDLGFGHKSYSLLTEDTRLTTEAGFNSYTLSSYSNINLFEQTSLQVRVGADSFATSVGSATSTSFGLGFSRSM